MQKSVGLLVAAVLAAAPGAAAAQSVLTLVVGGEAYEGPPRFEVTFNGTPIGEGVVERAIDTAASGRFIDATPKASHIESFRFDIPQDVFSTSGEVRVRLLNEANGGAGSVLDRNLYLLSAAVNGHEIFGPSWTTMSATGREANSVFDQFLVLFDGSREGVAAAPLEGWPEAGGDTAAVDVAAVTASAGPQAVATSTPVAPAVTEIRRVVAPPASTVPALPQTPPAAAAPTPAAVAPPAEQVAAVAPQQPPASVAAANPANAQCDFSEIYNVLGFNANSNDLTPRLTERLDQVLADIGTRKCRVQVVGYSSTQGDHATNALFAVERAQNVLRYLRSGGLDAVAATAAGAGATDRFGPDFAANRRVVITVTP